MDVPVYVKLADPLHIEQHNQGHAKRCAKWLYQSRYGSHSDHRPEITEGTHVATCFVVHYSSGYRHDLLQNVVEDGGEIGTEVEGGLALVLDPILLHYTQETGDYIQTPGL